MQIVVSSPKYGKQIVLLDDEDYYLIPNGIYLSKSGAHLYVRVKPSKQFVHRLITHAPSGLVVDHISRNTLDNRKSNLQVVTIQQNLRNQKRPNNKTGYTGVAIFPGGRFSAQIKVNYKKIHLGLFNTIEEAYQARLAAEAKYYDDSEWIYSQIHQPSRRRRH